MKENRLVESTILEEDTAEKSLRPLNLREFIGQEQACDNLKIYISAALKRGEALDHVLLHGPPGLGKTTLAQILAKELNVGFRTTSGAVLAKAGDLAGILTNLQPRDVLFIDEIHRLNPVVEEILYPALEDFKLDVMIGEGPAARSIQLKLPAFTLVAATTRSGLITAPLRDRFGIPVRLNFYTISELALIVQRAALLLDLEISLEGAHEIASRSRGTPRIAGRLLRRIRDFASILDKNKVDKIIADSALTRLGVDANGLDAMDQRYLRLIAEHYSGGPVGVDTLAAALSEESDVIEEVIEPYLIQQGFIQRTSRGRILTNESYRYLGLTPGSTSDLLTNNATNIAS